MSCSLEDKLMVIDEVKLEGVGIKHIDLDIIDEIHPVVLDICRNIKDIEIKEIKTKPNCFHRGCNEKATHGLRIRHLASAFFLRCDNAPYCNKHIEEIVEFINSTWGDETLFKYKDGQSLRIRIVGKLSEA